MIFPDNSERPAVFPYGRNPQETPSFDAVIQITDHNSFVVRNYSDLHPHEQSIDVKSLVCVEKESKQHTHRMVKDLPRFYYWVGIKAYPKAPKDEKLWKQRLSKRFAKPGTQRYLSE